MTENAFDVIVIGGGPAGSTAAAILAEGGASVLVLEKEKFPRYCIGESMLPYCYFSLERLGLLEKMASQPFIHKHSVQFVGRSGNVSAPFYFDSHMNHPAAQTWQVERADFDNILLQNARDKGAHVIEEMRVRDFLYDDQGAVVGVTARGKDDQDVIFQAPMTLDASGRNAVSASRHGWRVMDKQLKKIAIWTYYENALRDEGIDEGATTVAYAEGKNWFWYIPLQNNLVSVGIVGSKEYLYRDSKDLEAIFNGETLKNAWILKHLAPGRRVKPFQAIGDFSFRSRYAAADGLLLAGDAFSFLDPVFSSGLFLALSSGIRAGDAILAAKEAGDYAAIRFTDYALQLNEALENMRRLVYSFYDPNFNFAALFEKYPEMRAAVTDCLIGNLQRDFDPMFKAMSEFAELPSPPGYGMPLDRAIAMP